MFRGYYIASNGILNQQRTLNTISNNIANSQTPGFKADVSLQNTFKRQLILLGKGKNNSTGTIEYKYTDKSFTSLSQGTFEFTKKPLDVAIQGPVYFNVQTPTGEKRLTRNGQFKIDDEGYLAVAGAGRVLGENGPIQVGKSDFSITNDGQIYVDGNRIDRLSLSYVDSTQNVQKYGDNTFTLLNGATGEIPQGTEYSIIQGAYERSNVDISTEMTRAMSAQRSFEAMSQALKQIDSINQRTANELAKI